MIKRSFCLRLVKPAGANMSLVCYSEELCFRPQCRLLDLLEILSRNRLHHGESETKEELNLYSFYPIVTSRLPADGLEVNLHHTQDRHLGAKSPVRFLEGRLRRFSTHGLTGDLVSSRKLRF